MITEWLESLKRQAKRLKTELHALWLAGADPRTPRLARWLTIAVIAYALSPIDLIPDAIPIIGFLDDLILVPIGIAVVLKLIPTQVMLECRQKVEAEEFKPNENLKRTVAIFVVTAWIVTALLLLRMLYPELFRLLSLQ